MEHTAAQQAQKKLEEVMQKTTATTGEEGTMPSNVEIEEKMQALKMDVPREQLSDKGQEVAQKIDRLVEDTRRLFLEKNKDEDLQKAALHASRAAQIARRNELLTTPEGRRALEEAKEGTYSAIGFARLLVTSADFRDELIESLGLVQQALRRRPVGGTTMGGRTEEVKEGVVGRPVEEKEEEEDEEEEEYVEGETQEESLMQKKATATLLSQNHIDQVAHRFVRLLKRVQTKPEFRDSFRFLFQRLRGALEMGNLHAERMEQQLGETRAGRAFLAETQQAKDHAIRLIENWTEASLDPLFHQLNALNDQMQQDRETRAELRGLGDLVETNLTSGQMGNEDAVVQEAKERCGRVRERLLSKFICLLVFRKCLCVCLCMRVSRA